MTLAVSRTEQKKARERLQALAVVASNLNKNRLATLPVSAWFLEELQTLASITSAAAKNRQIKRVGKLMVEENRHTLVAGLFGLIFDPAQCAKIQTWETRLTLNDDNTLKQFVRTFNQSEYNTLKQLLLWIDHAKQIGDDELLAESVQDLHSYIKEVAILSAA